MASPNFVLREVLSYYGENLTAGIKAEVVDGAIVLRAPHVHLDEYWTPETTIQPENLWSRFADACQRLKGSRDAEMKTQGELGFMDRMDK